MDNIFQMSAQKLAFLGDAVYELFVREKIVKEHNLNIGELHKLKISKVCCEAQSEMVKKIESSLTEEELSIYKRGRNIKTGKVPKHVSAVQYHIATGLEALFGYLYLTNSIDRMHELLKIMDI